MNNLLVAGAILTFMGLGFLRVNRTYSFPVVEFALPDGRLWRASTDVNAASTIPPGTTVQVRYLPSDPDKVRLARNSAGFIPYIFLVLGVGLLIGGLVMLGSGAEIL